MKQPTETFSFDASLIIEDINQEKGKRELVHTSSEKFCFYIIKRKEQYQKNLLKEEDRNFSIKNYLSYLGRVSEK